MSIKTNELPQVERLEAEDRFLADTTAGTGGIAYGDVLEQVKGIELLPVMRSEASAQMSAANQFEAGVTSITNARTYPFNGSFATVVLAAPRATLDYTVQVELESANGNVQGLEVYDKQLNGFKIRYDGSATTVVKYYVTGGMQ